MKNLTGKVVSVKMNKTVVVEVVSKTPHPLYKKLMSKSKRYLADSGLETVNLLDLVQIKETRPMSKSKNFKIEKVLKREEK